MNLIYEHEKNIKCDLLLGKRWSLFLKTRKFSLVRWRRRRIDSCQDFCPLTVDQFLK